MRLRASQNFKESKDFYCALRWKPIWEDREMPELELAGRRFLLQCFCQKLGREFHLLHHRRRRPAGLVRAYVFAT